MSARAATREGEEEGADDAVDEDDEEEAGSGTNLSWAALLTARLTFSGLGSLSEVPSSGTTGTARYPSRAEMLGGAEEPGVASGTLEFQFDRVRVLPGHIVACLERGAAVRWRPPTEGDRALPWGTVPAVWQPAAAAGQSVPDVAFLTGRTAAGRTVAVRYTATNYLYVLFTDAELLATDDGPPQDLLNVLENRLRWTGLTTAPVVVPLTQSRFFTPARAPARPDTPRAFPYVRLEFASNDARARASSMLAKVQKDGGLVAELGPDGRRCGAGQGSNSASRGTSAGGRGNEHTFTFEMEEAGAKHVSSETRVMEALNINPRSWLRLARARPVATRVTNAMIELDARGATATALCRQEDAPELVAVMDIEAATSRGNNAFPDPAEHEDRPLCLCLGLAWVGVLPPAVAQSQSAVLGAPFLRIALTFGAGRALSHPLLPGVHVEMCADEAGMWARYRDLITTHFDVDVVYGWNHVGFDAGYAAVRCAEGTGAAQGGASGARARATSRFPRIAFAPPRFRITSAALGENEAFDVFPDRAQLDGLYFDKMGGAGRESYKLDAVAKEVLGGGAGKTGVTPGHLVQLGRAAARGSLSLPDGTPFVTAWGVMLEYCMNDCDVTFAVIAKRGFHALVNERAALQGTPADQFVFRGQQGPLMAMLIRAFHARGGVVTGLDPVRLKEYMSPGFEGAFVLEPPSGLLTSPTTVLDFSGLYPSLMRYYNLSPDTMIRAVDVPTLRAAGVEMHEIPITLKVSGGGTREETHYSLVYRPAREPVDADKTGRATRALAAAAAAGVPCTEYDVEPPTTLGGRPQYWRLHAHPVGIEGTMCESQRKMVGARAVAKDAAKAAGARARAARTALDAASSRGAPAGELATLTAALAGELAEQARQEARGLALKLGVNSNYGWLGPQEGGEYPFYIVAACVTATGRRAIQAVMERLRVLGAEEGFTVVYGDTDSVFINWDAARWTAATATARTEALAGQLVVDLFPASDVMALEFEKTLALMYVTGKKKANASIVLRDTRVATAEAWDAAWAAACAASGAGDRGSQLTLCSTDDAATRTAHLATVCPVIDFAPLLASGLISMKMKALKTVRRDAAPWIKRVLNAVVGAIFTGGGSAAPALSVLYGHLAAYVASPPPIDDFVISLPVKSDGAYKGFGEARSLPPPQLVAARHNGVRAGERMKVVFVSVGDVKRLQGLLLENGGALPPGYGWRTVLTPAELATPPRAACCYHPDEVRARVGSVNPLRVDYAGVLENGLKNAVLELLAPVAGEVRAICDDALAVLTAIETTERNAARRREHEVALAAGKPSPVNFFEQQSFSHPAAPRSVPRLKNRTIDVRRGTLEVRKTTIAPGGIAAALARAASRAPQASVSEDSVTREMGDSQEPSTKRLRVAEPVTTSAPPPKLGFLASMRQQAATRGAVLTTTLPCGPLAPARQVSLSRDPLVPTPTVIQAPEERAPATLSPEEVLRAATAFLASGCAW